MGHMTIDGAGATRGTNRRTGSRSRGFAGRATDSLLPVKYLEQPEEVATAAVPVP